MDLNQLLFHHQVALMRENGSGAGQSGVVDHYARKIETLRIKMGLSAHIDAQPAPARPS